MAKLRKSRSRSRSSSRKPCKTTQYRCTKTHRCRTYKNILKKRSRSRSRKYRKSKSRSRKRSRSMRRRSRKRSRSMRRRSRKRSSRPRKPRSYGLGQCRGKLELPCLSDPNCKYSKKTGCSKRKNFKKLRYGPTLPNMENMEMLPSM
jgi:hypothetical protein